MLVQLHTLDKAQMILFEYVLHILVYAFPEARVVYLVACSVCNTFPQIDNLEFSHLQRRKAPH